jgi:hypothetical protein
LISAFLLLERGVNKVARNWILLILGLLYAAANVELAQSVSSRQYFLRHPLIFLNLDGPPKVYSDHIDFVEKCRELSFRQPYDSHILNRGAKVTVFVGEVRDGFEKLTIETDGSRYTLLLAATSKNTRQRAFDLAFSSRPVHRPKLKIKTQSDVIKLMGFPIYRRCSAEEEEWFYILEFAPYTGVGFDGWWIKLKRGLVTDITGYH